jgi:hypothetical protein
MGVAMRSALDAAGVGSVSWSRSPPRAAFILALDTLERRQRMRRFAWATLPALLLAALLGCGHSGVPMGTVRVHLTDAPGDVQALHLRIVGVSVHRAGGEADGDTAEVEGGGHDSLDVEGHDDGGWETLSTDTTSVDLMTLRNGVTEGLAVGVVPAGRYTQIRLRLAPGSDVVIDDVAHPLVVPSGLTSGLKLIHPFVVPAGGEVHLTLDFDAKTSVIETGAGVWMLKPTIRITSD